jgi:PAS domain S-box-containing protein
MEEQQDFNRHYVYAVKTVAVVTCFTALLVLTGWLTGTWVLTSALRGMPTMKVNTAICFSFLGASLYLLSGKPTANNLFAARVLLFTVLTTALLTSFQYYTHYNLGIDELLFTDLQTRAKGGLYPGRMAHATSLGFIAISVGLLLPFKRSRTVDEVAQGLLWLAVFVAFVAFLGYIYAVPALYSISFISTMSLHTAVLLLLVALAGTMLRPKRGITGLFLGKGLGSVVFRQLSVFMLLSALFFGYLRLYAYRNGVVPDEFGIVLASLIYFAMGVGAIGFSARRLNRIDKIKQQAEHNLHELNANLAKLLEEKTRQTALAEVKFKRAFDCSSIGMALVSPDGKCLEVNHSISNMLGYTSNELRELTFQDITHPDDLGRDLQYVQQMLDKTIDTYQMEKRYFHKNGSVVWGLLSVSMLFNADGSPYCFLSQVQDITNRKKADEELKRVNRDLQAILNSGTHVSIITTDVNGVITHFSKGSETLLGYKAHEMEGKQTPALLHLTEEVEARSKKLTARYGKPIEGFDVFVERARQGLYESREWTYVRKDGSKFPVQLVVTALKNERDEVTGFLGIATDLTETKATEEAMRKVAEAQAKTRELEQFTYIASHDLQEPLRSLASFTELLYTGYSDKMDEQGRMMLEYSRSSAARMSELIQGLLFYSRIGQERKLELVNTAETVKQVMQDLAHSIKETGAEITATGLPELSVYPVEFRQLIQNLVNNAIKFRRKEVAPKIDVTAEDKNGSVHFRVADNGIGIAEKDREKVFILFKRLHDREDYPGTGIGLAHCKKIVEMHGGNIWIEPNTGGGTVFNFNINT